MFSDISEVVSHEVQIDMERTFGLLFDDSGEPSSEHLSSLDEADLLQIQQASEILEKLFVWDETGLGDAEEFRLLLCRALEWYAGVLENVKHYGWGIIEIAKITISCLQSILDGKSVNEFDFDPASYFLLEVSAEIKEYLAKVEYLRGEEPQ